MASFTDNISTFNPYLSQLPIIEEMSKVGQEKQQLYNQGVQKIQTQIDNVAGLDIIRDVDKQHLQSKLNELGGKLKTVAAGDFSNFQLVNSVGGMVGQLSKDSDIINAVSSTQRYRDEARNMETDRKEGKSSAQNQWDFTNKANDWIHSGDVKQTFNGRYSPYINVDKNWLDVYKGLHSDLRDVDIPYEKNADGSLNVQKTAAAMQKLSKETVSAAQIENAIRSSLTPDEQNQLSINGRYQFRGYDTPEKLAASSTAKFNSQITTNNNSIQTLTGLANLSTSDPVMHKQYLDSLAGLKQVNSTLENQKAEELSLISKDPDLAKTEIYKNGAIAQFATAHSWAHDKVNLATNVVAEGNLKMRDEARKDSALNFDIYKQDYKEKEDRLDRIMKDAEFAMKMQAFNIKFNGQGSQVAPATGLLGLDTHVKDIQQAMTDDVTALEKASDTSVINTAKKIGVTPGQYEKAIEDYNSGDATRLASSLNVIPVEYRDGANQIINDRQEAKRLKAALSSIVAEVYGTPERKQMQDNIIASVQDLPPLSVKDAQGRTVTFTPTEFATYLSKKESTPPPFYGDGGDNPLQDEQITFNRSLSEKEKLLNTGQLDSEGHSIYGKYQQRISDKVAELNVSTKDELAKKLLERSGSYLPTMTSIAFSSEHGDIERRKLEGLVVAASSTYDKNVAGQAGGDVRMSQAQAKTANEWVSGKGKEDIVYQKLTQGNTNYLQMTKGGEKLYIPLTKDQVKTLPISTLNQPSDTDKAIMSAQSLGNGSTNPTGNYADAYFNRSRIPQVTLEAKADLTWNDSNHDKQYVNMYLNTPGLGLLKLKHDSPMDTKQASEFVIGLTNEKVKQFYLQNPNVSEEWKAEIKKLK